LALANALENVLLHMLANVGQISCIYLFCYITRRIKSEIP